MVCHRRGGKELPETETRPVQLVQPDLLCSLLVFVQKVVTFGGHAVGQAQGGPVSCFAGWPDRNAEN